MSDERTIKPNAPADFTPQLGDYKTLQPFRYWCQKVLPLVYDDSLSYYELLCKVVDYLNKTMEDVETLHDDVTSLHSAYEKLQSYVNNYFSTLDVQNEINKKLDEMTQSGELQKLFDIPDKTNVSNLCLGHFFTSNSDITNTLYISGDGVTFNPIRKTFKARDTDILYLNGVFYIAYTHLDINELSEFYIDTTTDFINFNTHIIKLGSLTDELKNSLAPNWFLDSNGDIYILFGKQVGSQISDGTTYPDYRIYITKAIDLNSMTFEPPTELNLLPTNIIDPCVIKKDSTYYLYVKKELNDGIYNGGSLMIFTSTDLLNWTLITKEISSFYSKGKFEAPCVIKYNDKYLLYADNYNNDYGSFYYYAESSDLINWSDIKPINCNNETRHGCVMPLKTYKTQSIISSLYDKHINTIDSSGSAIYNRPIKYIDSRYAQNKYIDLFSIDFVENYKTITVIFIFSDAQGGNWCSNYVLEIIRKNNNYEVNFYELTYTVRKSKYVVKVRKENDKFIVFMDVGSVINCTPVINITGVSKNRGNIEIIPYNIYTPIGNETIFLASDFSVNFNTLEIYNPTPSENCNIKSGSYILKGLYVCINIRIKSLINSTASNEIVLKTMPIPYDKSSTNIALNCADVTTNTPVACYLNANGDILIYGLLQNHDYIISGSYFKEK